MVHRAGPGLFGRQEQMIDALVFSLAVYETAPEKVLSVLKYKYDLPIGALDLLSIDGIVSNGILTASPGQRSSQPIIVGRSTHGHVVVACRGTADLFDLIQDLKVIPKWLRGSSTGAAAHMGFVERAESVDIQPFLQLLNRGEKLVFTGHSLGGAVSSLLALRVLEAAENFNICTHLGQVQCVTFGAPLFASPSLANCINEKYNDRFCHVVSKHDLIPRIVPLVRMGMRLSGCGTDDVSEGVRLARLCLDVVENVTKIPIASAIRTVEDFIPQPIRSFFSNAIRLLWPQKTHQQYSFAGKFVFVDPLAQKDEGAVSVARAEDLNAFSSEVAFALGLNMNVAEHHGLSAYKEGLVKGLKTRLLAHFQKKIRQHGSEADQSEWIEVENRWGLLPSQKLQSQLPLHLASPTASRQRHSMSEYVCIRPSRVAAAAMEAASAGYRTVKMARLRSSMERKLADCAATLAVLADTKSSGDQDTEKDGGASCHAQPSSPFQTPYESPSGRPIPRRLDLGENHERSNVSAQQVETGPRCCPACKAKRPLSSRTMSANVALDLTLKECTIPEDRKPEQTPKFRFHFGWIMRTVLRVAQFARSLNTFTVTCCAIRFFLGSPLF